MLIEGGGLFGELKKFVVRCGGEDITAAVASVQIFQDIFLPTWSARIGMNDTNNVILVLPIFPGSEISIEVETGCGSEVGDGEKSFTFFVHSISDRKFISQRHSTYVLNLVGRELLLNQSLRLSKSYSNQRPEEIIKSILSDKLGGELVSEKSQNKYQIIIPNWSPFTAIHWCSKIAISKDNAADFIFFMKDQGKFWFKPIEKLYADKSEESGVEFMFNPSMIAEESGDYKTDYGRVIRNYRFEHYQGPSNLTAGFYTNKILTYDFVNKKWEQKIFNYGDDIQADKKMKPWDSEFFDNVENANVSFMPKHPELYKEGKMSPDDTVTDWHPSRKTNLLKLEQDKLIIQLSGGIRLWELLGQSCTVRFPSQQDVVENIESDKQFDGRYLVAAICHTISKAAYMVNFELVKKRHSEKVKPRKK